MGDEDRAGALNTPAKSEYYTLTPSILQPKIAIPPGMPTSNPPPPVVQPARAWNTSNLGLRVGFDMLSAGAAGVLVAPIITMIDKGIIENASGRNTLGVSLQKSALELVRSPHRFIGSRPFALIFVCYVCILLGKGLMLTLPNL